MLSSVVERFPYVEVASGSIPLALTAGVPLCQGGFCSFWPEAILCSSKETWVPGSGSAEQTFRKTLADAYFNGVAFKNSFWGAGQTIFEINNNELRCF